MRVTPLAPFGARIEEVEIGALEPAPAAALSLAVARAGVAVLPERECDDAAFTIFLASLGALTFTEGETPVPGAERLNLVSNVGRDRPPRSVFHTDTSYVATPPSFTALRAVRVPEAGGATEFTDQRRAYERLDAATRAALAGAEVLHRVTGLGGRDDEIWHPLPRRHEPSGRIALFLSTPERCVALRGGAEGCPDLPTLYAHSIAGEVFSHRWRPGDVVIWDNRVTMHRADHSGVVGDRVLHRGMVLGEAPIPA